MFGAVRPVVGRAVGDALAECVSPSAAPGAGRFVSVASREDDRLVADGNGVVDIVVAPALAAAFPTRGPSAGGVRLVVVVDGDVETDAGGGVVDAACAFGARVAAASASGNAAYGALAATTTAPFAGAPNVWACLVPATPPGVVGVRARASQIAEMRSASFEGVTFAFAPTARARATQPATVTSDARAVVRVVGVDLPEHAPRARRAPCCAPSAASTPRLPPRLCRPRSRRASRRTRRAAAAARSSCGSSRRAARRGPRTKAPRRSRLCRRRAPRVSRPPPDGTSEASPSPSPSSATAPELTQASFPPFACQFGSLAPVAARAAGPDAMLCVAPAAAPGARPVGVAPGLVGAAGGAPTFTHRRAPSVLAAAPAVASTVGDGTEVTFYLDARGGRAEADEADSLACHVDGAVVPARRVGGRVLRPAGARGGRGGNFARLRVFRAAASARAASASAARATSSSPSCCSWRRPRSARTNRG